MIVLLFVAAAAASRAILLTVHRDRLPVWDPRRNSIEHRVTVHFAVALCSFVAWAVGVILV